MGPYGRYCFCNWSFFEYVRFSQLLVISEIILGFLSGVIVAILKYGKYDEVSTANKSAAAKYASLEANVRRQLSLYRSDRTEL